MKRRRGAQSRGGEEGEEQELGARRPPCYGPSMIALSPETEALARRLAAAEGVGVDDAIRRALEEKARGGAAARKSRPTPEEIARRKSAMDGIAAEIAAMPILDPRSPQEIMDELNEP